VILAAELLTPIDEATGIPLPLYPSPDLPPVLGSGKRNIERIADWHHPFHPAATLKNNDIGDGAVRNCRVQWSLYDEHHHQYHGAYLGPQLPKTEDEKFKTVVFAAAGYIPDRALSFKTPHKPQVVILPAEVRAKLWSSNTLQVGQPASVHNFLLYYALKQDFSSVTERTIDEFLHTRDIIRKDEWGRTLLGLAVYEAARPVKDLYKSARDAERIPPERARTAARFIFKSIDLQTRRKKSL
jgi:hypothetical protein